MLVAGFGFFDPPSARGWVPLLRRLADRLASEGPHRREVARNVLDLINRGRLADALSFFRRQLPDEALRQVLAESLATGAGPSPAIESAAIAPFRGVVSTSFDDVWEKVWRARGGRRLLPRQLNETRGLDDGAGPFVLPALGTLGDPESLCLSPADLRRRPLPGAVAAFLRGLFSERTFVFAGFQPGDPDLRLVLEHMLGAAPTKGEHYILLPNSSLAPDAEFDSGVLAAGLDLIPVRWGGTLEEFFAALGQPPPPGHEHDTDPGGTMPRFHVSNGHNKTPAIEVDRSDWIRETHNAIAAAGPGDRAGLFERAGDYSRDPQRNPVQAISYYRSALVLEPGRRSALAKLAELYAAHKHHSAAEEILARLAQTEPPGEGRARLLRQEAAIANDELDRPARAAQLLDKALEEAPHELETFEALERLFNQEKNWQALARLYQKMARELDADGPGRVVKLRAMDGLADLGLRFSKDPRIALKALEAADAIDAGNIDRKALMAGLYQQVGPGEYSRAAALHHATIAADPERFGSYRALAELYRSTGEQDRLWCVAATLSFLRKADDELRTVFESGRAARARPPEKPLSPEVWSRVAHPDEDRDFSQLFVTLGPVLASVAATPLETLGLRPEDRVDFAALEGQAGATAVARAIAIARRGLDVPLLDIYAVPSERRPMHLRMLRVGNEITPALILGAPLLNGGEFGEALFAAARAMVAMRGERIVCALPTGRAGVRLGFEAALLMGGLKPPSEAMRAEVERLLAQIEAMLPKPQRERMVASVRRLVAKHGGAFPDVDRWFAAIELSSARAAFLLVNDLVIAARALATDVAAGSAVTAKLRLKDLVAFSISEAYFEGRRALGFS
ncbi:MAG TPA: SIR2 family protein [Polyangia bacterium]